MDIIIFVLVLGMIILIHELGHFIFAKRAKVLCHEFAIGMGPVIYQKRNGETVYSLRMIPLGGYVSMAGEDMGSIININQRVGINLDESGNVKEFVLNENIPFQFIARVKEFDLKGIDDTGLYIILSVDGEDKKFIVNTDAKYLINEKKEMQIAPANRSYEYKTLWQRFLIVFAGPAANFLLAFLLLFTLAFFIGKPVNDNIVGKVDESFLEYNNIKKGDTISKVNGVEVKTFDDIVNQIYLNASYQINMTINNKEEKLNLLVAIQGLGIVNQISKDELIVGEPFGKEKDLKANDKILGIYMSDETGFMENIPYKMINTWEELISYASEHANLSHVRLLISRDNKEKQISYDNITKNTMEKLGSPYIGYGIGFSQHRKFDILYPLYYPFKVIGSNIKEMFVTLGLIFGPKTGVGVGDLSGPVGIFSMVKQARMNGIESFIKFVAFLSVNIGLLNLLPIPALDGGRLIFIGYEAVTKKKVNKKIENTLIMITFLLLFALMIFVTFNDVLKIFK